MENYIQKLDELKQNSCFRSIKNIEYKSDKLIKADGELMLNLSSNDYLNVSTNKYLIMEFLEKYKNSREFLFSSTSARLLTGNSLCYKKLEQNFAKLFNKQKALLFNTGYQCNQGVISTLFSKGDVIFCDKLNHASIISGLRLSSAEHFRYLHNDMENLELLLKKHRGNYKNAVIVTESVFSMDGDISNLKKLVELKKKYNCLLMVDEAHAFGVFGEQLQGVCAELNISDDIDIITVTLGKALASQGAVCISKIPVIDYLINKASSFIFSTAIPPISVLWTNFLMEEKFNWLITQKQKLNDLFKKVHKIYPTVSSSQIIPIVIGDSALTSQAAQILQHKGYYVLPINPPTVPQGTSRLRLSLCADMNYLEIEKLFDIIKGNNAI